MAGQYFNWDNFFNQMNNVYQQNAQMDFQKEQAEEQRKAAAMQAYNEGLKGIAQEATAFNGYDPQAKIGIMDKILPWQTDAEKSVMANRKLDEISRRIYGSDYSDLHQRDETTLPLDLLEYDIEGAKKLWNGYSNAVTDVVENPMDYVNKIDNGARTIVDTVTGTGENNKRQALLDYIKSLFG